MMIETFPLIQLMTVYEVTLTPGQCLFVPAFWWVQSNTPKDVESIYLESQFAAHSKLWALVNKGIEHEIII